MTQWYTKVTSPASSIGNLRVVIWSLSKRAFCQLTLGFGGSMELGRICTMISIRAWLWIGSSLDGLLNLRSKYNVGIAHAKRT
jgi:hypothetical protein